jgi:plasmid maintenance system antidote protein VapI
MLLDEYIRKNGIKVSFLEEKLGISRPTIGVLKKGGAVSPEIAKRVEDFTKGQVQVKVLTGIKSHVRNRKKNFTHKYE